MLDKGEIMMYQPEETTYAQIVGLIKQTGQSVVLIVTTN